MHSLDLYTGGLFQLILNLGPVAKTVVFILLFFSIVCWAIIFYKLRELKRVEKEGERFMRIAGGIDSFKKLLTSYREDPENPFYKLVFVSYREFFGKENPSLEGIDREKLENRLRIVASEEIDGLSKRLSFLATTANTAPFIGLFGTVWGIMDAFREIGLRGTTSLAVVAPGISEALVTTALGLATAIPAVLAYNYFIGKLKAISTKMESATLYILNLAKR